ncbi:MAG: tetratricopeptide repeat protein [Planktothrix sp. GU0601_MAG3]|nr:MAG: tetratricopeptide repeat protein [Planktothrix sp. GU0601_MAG3]
MSLSLEQQLNYWTKYFHSHPNDIRGYIQRGMVYFKLGKITESIQDFDQAEKLDPSIKPYLWQRGLSYYYTEQYQLGAEQFEIDLTVNSQDVEETVWRYLCIAQFQGIEVAKNTLLPVKNDPRPVLKSVYELFAGNCTPEDLLKIGQKQGKKGNFYSHLYLGLYYEAEQNIELAKTYINQAATQYEIDDYMWNLAVVHQKIKFIVEL